MRCKFFIVMSILVCLCQVSLAEFDPQVNLIGHWRFDETTGSTGYDSISNVDMRVLNLTGSDHWVDGKFGGAVDFNGVGCATPDTATWTINDLGGFQEKTISMWVKFNNISGVQYLFLLNWSDYKATVLNYDGQLRMQYGDTVNPAGDVRVSGVFQTGQWYHVVLLSRNTPDGLSQMETWVDGVLVASKSELVRDDSGLMNSVGFGGSRPQDGGVQMMYGQMDDLRVYDSALTSDQIADLYEYEPQISSEDLYAYLPMDEYVSYWAYDVMGNFGGEIKGTGGAYGDDPAEVWNPNGGKFNGCFDGDGVENRIAMSTNPADYANEDMGLFQNKTVAAWICPKGATSPVNNTVQFIFALINGADQPYKFYLLLNNGAIRVQDAASAQQWTLPVIDGQTWYHIAVVNANTADGLSEYRLYVNGDLKLTKANVARDTVGRLYFPSIAASAADKGQTDPALWRTFYGKIDEFRIYDSVLTDTEVADLVALVPDQKQFDPKADLELYWKFDEQNNDTLLEDSSSNDRYGQMNNYDGSTNRWVSGVFNNAFDFDGTTQSVTFANRNNEFSFGPFKDKTVSCWIKPDDLSGVQNIMNILPQGDHKFYFYLNGANIRGHGIKFDASGDVKFDGPAIPTGQWSHVAVVMREYNSAAVSCEIYVNGIQQAMNKYFFNTQTTRLPITVGAARGFDQYANNWFDGMIDDFRIYDTDLAPNDVNDIYFGGPLIMGDIDNDGDVDGSDLGELSGSWVDSTVVTPATASDFEKGTFEEYADQAALDAYWSDFGQSASAGSTAMSQATLLTDPQDAHSGSQALRWQFNTNDFSGNGLTFTDLVFALDNPVDLTDYDYLSLWIKRAAGNPQQTGLYVKFLNGGTGFSDAVATSILTYEEGSTAEPAGVWDNWLVDLNSLLQTTYVSVELDDVRGILIGCYDSDGNEGVGTIDIDDIELINAPECSGMIGADINGDCVVDMGDYSILADNWMSY